MSPATPAATAAENRRGIFAVLAASTLFICNDTFVKLATSAYPTGQIMVVRGLFATLVMFIVVAASGKLGALGALRRPLVLLRAGCEGLVALTFIIALGHLPLADITAILQATPILLTLIAAALGIEKVGWRRWSAVCVGFLGMLLVVKPGGSSFTLYTALALACAAIVAMRDLITRRIPATIPTVVVSLGTTMTVVLFGLGLGVEDWRPLQWRETLYLAGAAIVVSTGNVFIIAAYRTGDVAVVSPFRYSVVVWAGLIGYLLFGDVPDRYAILGTLLIVGSGLYTVHRERIRARSAPAPEVKALENQTA
jgi:drug/metabolite transporter (DMT)-like permease